MTRRSLLPVALALACAATSAQAGSIFNWPKKSPADQVVELTKTLRTDADERHRVSAAGDLSKFDARAHPTAVTTLIESTLKDPSAAVRVEAAQALGRARPISAQAAYALEYSLANDASTRVREAAKSALWQYHVAGYRGNTPAPQTSEPNLATRQPAQSTPARQAPRATTLPTRPVANPAQSTPGALIDPPAEQPRPVHSTPAPLKLDSATPINLPA